LPVTSVRTLITLRHARTEDVRPGGRDLERRLTAHGEQQARAVGDFLRREAITVDTVLCSAAVRARRTLELLGLPTGEDGPQTTISEQFYSAGTDSLIEAVRALPDDRVCALLVGHAPGLPGVVYEVTDPESADPGAWAAIERGFPAATLARLEWAGGWADLGTARLISVRLPD
jgi:phosphohistidine phosphatase